MPRNASDRIISASGITIAYFLLRYTPPNKAMARIGVKFARWGINLNIIPTISNINANISSSFNLFTYF
jgi:hypothetical protein